MAITVKKITDYRKFSDGNLYEVHPKTEASQVTGLSTVATTGSYNDLANKPLIVVVTTEPTTSNTSSLPNNSLIFYATDDA